MKNFFTINSRILLLCCAIVCLVHNLGQTQTLAFPGAEGFGRFTQGARGAANPEVYVVTNLNDSGAGSFRDAVSQPGRFVVFAVGGIIRLESQIVVAPNTTIAGQTAPGDGVVFFGKRVTFTGASNTIARYLRIRLGAGGNGKNDDASGISNGANMIFDHMSFTWGLDEVFSINWDGNNPSIDNITVQNSIIGQGLHRHNHSAGGLIQPQDGGKVSLIKNLYISNKTRNPKVKGINEFVNNVVYNYGNYGNDYGHTVSGDGYIMGGSEGDSRVNIINNYFVGGPLTPPGESSPFSRGTPTFHLYGTGNYFDNNKDGILNGTLVPYNSSSTGYPGIAPEGFKTEPFDYPAKNPTMTAEEAYQYILENVGPRYPRLDQVDNLLMNEVASRGTDGLYVYRETDLPLANGGLGEVFNGPVPLDSDLDGMPDDWEDAHGLNKNSKADAVLASSSNPEYLNIEVYINSIMETPAPDFLRPPTSVTATATSTTEIALSWADNTDREDHYIIERATDGTTFTEITQTAANTTTYTDTGLDPKTTYHYRLKAVNATEESGYSQTVSINTLGVPDAPSNPQPTEGAIYRGAENITLSWTGSDNTSTYKVYFGTDANNLTHQGDVTTSSIEVPNLSENTTYYWKVDAVNAQGTTEGSIWSFTTENLMVAELVGHWSLDTSSGTTAEDATAYQNHGQVTDLSNPQWVSGRAGNALDLSNATTASRIVVPHQHQLYFDEGSFSVSFWMKAPTNLSTAQAYLFHKGAFARDNQGGEGKWFGMELKDNLIRFAVDDDVTKTELQISDRSPFLTGDWVHVVAIRDTENDKLLIYRDGLKVAETADNTNTPIGTELPLLIGNSYIKTAPYKGMLDEFKVFNYALSPQEITELYVKAVNPSPAHQASDIDPAEVALGWTSSATSFNVYVGTSADDLSLEGAAINQASYSLADLSGGTTYFWRVDAITGNEPITGDTWSFTTRQTMAKASSPTPAHGTEDVAPEGIVLSWSGDAERYVVHMGNAPDKLEQKSAEIETASYEVSEPLNHGTSYYWRVDALKGEELQQGDVWSFTTAELTSVANLESGEAFKCFPNPFSDQLTVAFSLEQSETVKISLYDNQNRLIHTFMRAPLNEGKHQLTFKPQDHKLSGLPKGVYYLALQTSAQKSVQKLVK